MKINYQPNPFKTTIELDDRDKHMIVLAYKNEALCDMVITLSMDLNDQFKNKQFNTLDDVKKHVSGWEKIVDLDIDSDEIKSYISFLNEEHMGDCTCIPCTCMRCYVEDMLEIRTLAGLGKHSARKIQGAFGKDSDKSIDEAIAVLEQKPHYIKPYTWPDQVGWDQHIPRWEKEREVAIKWLKKYKEEHGF